MQLELITSAAGMQTLQGDWEALFAEATFASPFMSWDWQNLWWKHYGDGHALRIVTAREGGRLVGLLPLYIRRQRELRGWVPVRVLQPIGVGGDTAPDYLDPLLLEPHAAAATGELARFITRDIGGWDELRMSDLRDGLPFRAALEGASRTRGLPTATSLSAEISYVPLPKSWDEYLKSVSRERRYKIRSVRKKFEELPGARFYCWSDGGRLDAAIERLIELHHLRWKERNTRHAFSTDAYRNFHRELMHAFWARDQLRLYCLEVEGNIIMMFYCYKVRGVVYHFQTGFDPAWSKSRPGHVIVSYLMEHAIGEGASEFDMLRGQYAFKADYARDTRQTHCVTAAGTALARWVNHARRVRRALLDPRAEKPAANDAAEAPPVAGTAPAKSAAE